VRLFRRSRLVAVVGAVLLAAAIAGVVVAITTGSGEPATTVTPDSVAVLDADGKLVADVPIGGRPISIAIDDGAVWVANPDDGTVLRLDAADHEVVQTIGLGADVNSIAVGFGSVWVAGGNAETVSRIDPDENALEATLRLGKADPLRPDPIFFVAAGREAVWITQGRAVLRIDPATNRATKRVALPSLPIDLGAGGGSVWVPLQDERLVRIDEGSASISATTQLSGWGSSPIVESGDLWLILNTETPQVSKLDPGTLAQAASVPFPAVTQANFPAGLAASDGVLWTADHGSGVVSSIDAVTARAERVTRVAYHPISVAASAGAVWIGVQEN
jgi:DNA-binding beta-propeller fold protein YncE